MLSIALFLVLLRPIDAASDLFNYDATTSFDSESGTTHSYGPDDWSQVSCDDLETCPGWPEKWVTAVDWSLQENHCRNCRNGCTGVHHQSPIDLSRRWGYEDTPDDAQACIDWHWISYFDGSCTWDMLKDADAFSIERHALRIGQPLERVTGGYRLACADERGKRLFPRLDFPSGFSSPFFLSHTDIKVPSEHTQDGIRFSAEIQLPHFFSISAKDNKGVPNQMGTVAMFLEAREGHSPNAYLEKVICQFRNVEDIIRKECNMNSVTEPYPGCSTYNRTTAQGGNRYLRQQAQDASTALDRLLKSKGGNSTLEMDPLNFQQDPPAADYKSGQQRNDHTIDFDEVPHHNYQWINDVRTEYYFRYAGTQTIPPCYGEFEYSRSQTNHWRVFKDPIVVHPRQITELHRLLRDRIAPADDLHVEARCKADTAAKIFPDGSVSVARPVQTLSGPHYNTFCECRNWRSQWPEDQLWCDSGDEEYRFYENRYNAESDRTTCTLGNFLGSANTPYPGLNAEMPSIITSETMIQSPTVDAFLFQRKDGNLMVVTGNSSSWGKVLWQSGISVSPGSYYSELNNQGMLSTRREVDDGVVWSTDVAGPSVSNWFALDCDGKSVGIYQGRYDTPGNVTWKSTPLVPFAVTGIEWAHWLHVPFHTSALYFTNYLDSDTLHDGRCWDGPVDAKPVNDEVCNGRGSPCSIGWTTGGEELTYMFFTTDAPKYFVAPNPNSNSSNTGEAMQFHVILRLSSLSAGREVQVEIDSSSESASMKTLGGGWEAYHDLTWTTTLTRSGKHHLRVKFIDGGTNLCSISVLQ